MIRWNVRPIAERKGWNIGQFAEASGIAYSSALDLWHGRPRRIDLAVLGRLCDALECSPSDVLVKEGASAESPAFSSALVAA
jgi:DNA-binding Xre family transcriptional regulator